jgi:hypothetical protein
LRIRLKDGKNSFVWKYFGECTELSGKRIASDQVYCSLCFDKGKLKSYKESVSTTNLAGHLREAHGKFAGLLLMINEKRGVFCQISTFLFPIHTPLYWSL